MKFPKILSILLHPIFIPTFVMLVLLHEVEFFNILLSNYKKTLIIIMVIFTIVLPIIILLLLLKLARIKSLEMETVKERNLPLFYTILMMIIGFSFFKNIAFLSIHLCSIYLSGIIVLIIAFLITKKWKISLHMLGVGAALGSLINMNIVFGNLFNWILGLIVISGLLAYSRLELKAHNKKQIYAGFVLGCVLQSTLTLYFSLNFSVNSIFL